MLLGPKYKNQNQMAIRVPPDKKALLMTEALVLRMAVVEVLEEP